MTLTMLTVEMGSCYFVILTVTICSGPRKYIIHLHVSLKPVCLNPIQATHDPKNNEVIFLHRLTAQNIYNEFSSIHNSYFIAVAGNGCDADMGNFYS
jgi:hypothetical protein